jgi:hypothetical protein
VQVMGVGIVLAATVLVQLPERSRLPVTQSSRK